MSEVMNESGMEPKGRAVLLKPYEMEKKHGLIHIPDQVKERTQMVEQRAVVIAVGESCWADEPAPRAKVGDKVLVAKYAGTMAMGPKDGHQYRFVNDRDIFAVITEENDA